MIFEIFIKPLLLRLMGHTCQPLILPAMLTDDLQPLAGQRAPLSFRSAMSDGRATLLPYHGSAHLHALSQANALLRVPAGQLSIPAGSTVDVRYL